MTNKRILSILCIVSMTVTCLNLLGKEALAGDFSGSCKDLKLTDGHVLSATCKDRGANFRNTSLDLNSGIGNKDGHLITTGGYAGTCKNIGLNGNSLRADCKTYKGDWRSTNLDLNRVISNQDGNLAFDDREVIN